MRQTLTGYVFCDAPPSTETGKAIPGNWSPTRSQRSHDVELNSGIWGSVATVQAL